MFFKVHSRARRGLGASVIAAMLISAGAGGLTIGMTSAAWAQAALTTEQSSAFSVSLNAAIRGANGSVPAMQAAISQAVQSAVSSNATAAGGYVSVTLTAAEAAGATPATIGAALGQAAAAVIAAGNRAAAVIMATTIANEGSAAEIAAFQSAVAAAGFNDLSDIAGRPPAATGAIGNGPANVFGATPTGTTPSPGCLNPSCTSL